MKARIILITIITLLTLAADQGSKHWAKDNLKGTQGITLISNYLGLEYHENPGSAFGMFRNVPGARYFLIGFGMVAMVMIFFMIRKIQHQRTTADIAFAFILGGALGNQIDRIYMGRVVDFILMHWQRKYAWPAYNVADAALVAGVILLVLVLGRKPEIAVAKTKNKQKAKRSKK